MFDFMDMDFDSTAVYPESNGPYIPEAGDCIRCGMCVSNCPTFKLFQIDEETPRRRIRTISKLLVENQPISAEERRHLDNCLQCRACETICPSRMNYGQLFDQAQLLLNSTPTRLARLVFWLLEHKRPRSGVLFLLAAYLKSGLQKPLRASGLLRKIGLQEAETLASLPVLHSLAESYSCTGKLRGKVALFSGCIAEPFDHDTLQAAIKLLNAIGYEVLVPTNQGCCGAIHQHHGQSAAKLIAKNLATFNALDVEAVLHTASGCGTMLSEYQSDDSAAEQLFRQRLQDINDFLLSHWPENLPLSPYPKSVAVHEPCSQRNVLKNQQNVYQLLAKIPELKVMPLADNQVCCGSGGGYMLTHPENAAQLRTLKQQAISNSQAELVVSSNFGCAMYLNAEGATVIHPVSLLASVLLDKSK